VKCATQFSKLNLFACLTSTTTFTFTTNCFWRCCNSSRLLSNRSESSLKLYFWNTWFG